jgi:5'-phosphate synthase pdxT subunit
MVAVGVFGTACDPARRNHSMLTVGVVAIQGAVSEHVTALEKSSKDLDCKIVTIKRAGIVPHCDGLIIPGGESTTISRIMRFEGIDKEILENKGIPMMGTCAGLIIMSDYKNERVEGLGLIDMQVKRNAFGRQAESFQVPLTVTVFDSPFDGIFIRAPAITQVGDATDVLAHFEKYGVAAQQGNKLALAFHPELGNDLRFHEYFLRLFDFDR